MLLPSTVNYPCQPRRIKHRRRRPAQSLTRAGPPPPHQLQNKWLLVSLDTAPALVWPPWHRDSPQHRVLVDGFPLESTRSAGAGDGLVLPAATPSSLYCWFSSCSPGVAPAGCPCHRGDAASSGLTSCCGGRSTQGRREASAQLPLRYFPGKDLWKANPEPVK